MLGPTLEVLDLSTNRLRGTLSTDIFFFFFFFFVDDDFESSFTSISSLLPNLRVLDLSKNELEGTILEDVSHDLPSLQVFSLSEHLLEGPLSLQINTNILEDLLLDSNNLSGTIPFEQWFASIEITMPTIPTTNTTSTTSTTTSGKEEDNADNEWFSDSFGIAMSMEGGEESNNNNIVVHDVNNKPTIGLYNNPASSSSSSSSGPSLKVVDFSNNMLTGTIPNNVFNNVAFGNNSYNAMGN